MDSYLSQNADMKTAFGNDKEKVLKHFAEYGMKEGENLQWNLKRLCWGFFVREFYNLRYIEWSFDYDGSKIKQFKNSVKRRLRRMDILWK